MNNKLKELYEKVSADESLIESFKKGMEALSNDDEKKNFIIDFAKEQGITLTMEDLSKIEGVQHVSDDDLEKVVGGGFGDEVTSFCGNTYFIVCSALWGSAGISDLVYGDC